MENKIEINQKNRSQNRSLSVHFSELRKRIIFSLIIYLVATVAGFALHREILEIIVRPVAGINELTQGLPVFTNITEFWGVVMRVSLLTGLLISFPFIIYHPRMVCKCPALSGHHFALVGIRSGYVFACRIAKVLW